MTVTIKDVARDAGVSIATVSRVLNGKGPVNAKTRLRILKAAKRLRYVPHGAARSLITRRTNTVGVLLPDIHGEFFSEVIRGIDRAARDHGYYLLVTSSRSDPAGIEAALHAVRGRVDGQIVMTPDVQARALRTHLPEALPLVLLNCGVNGGAFDYLDVDNHGGAVAMVKHLARLGHRRIAFVRGPARNHDARERLAGYREAMRSLPGGGAAALEIEGDFSEESGCRAGRRLLAMARRPTAVFAANDAMALGVLSALRQARLRVPEDIALVGFDDIPLSRFLSPPLTSVHVPIFELGTRAVERLLHGIEMKNRHAPRHETLPTTLVVRASCGSGAEGRGGGTTRTDGSGHDKGKGAPRKSPRERHAAGGAARP